MSSDSTQSPSKTGSSPSKDQSSSTPSSSDDSPSRDRESSISSAAVVRALLRQRNLDEISLASSSIRSVEQLQSERSTLTIPREVGVSCTGAELEALVYERERISLRLVELSHKIAVMEMHLRLEL